MAGSYIRGDSDVTCIRAGSVHRVPKKWGEEQWIVNKEYCGKKLLLYKNHRCSMHSHAQKDEVFYVQSGTVRMELGKKTFTLGPGDFVHVRAGVPHRFTGLTQSEIIEFSTNHREEDSFRSEFSGHVDQERYDRQSALIGAFSQASVLVVGDAMLDTYTGGDVTRISPEAPIPVMRFRRRTHVPGGAANAAANVASLGGAVTLLGLRGKDAAGKTLETLLRKQKVRSLLIADADRVTTEKQRVVAGDGHQLVRVDYEDTHAPSEATQRALLSALKTALRKHRVLLLSEYAKGVFTPRFLKECITMARAAKIPVILDPKPRGPEYLADAQGVTLLTPNRYEAELLDGGRHDSPSAIAASIARVLSTDVLCTLGGEGMILASSQGAIRAFPALASGVVDVSGAGDTVAATLALSLAAGASLEEAVDLANRAASVVVEKPGTATLNAEELLRSL